MSNTGIDALAFYIPRLYVSLSELAEKREIPFEKLRKGLGLQEMAIADLNEDAASFAAAALIRLIEDHNLDPREIGRVYLGTESAVDGSKPTATYAVGTAETYFADKYGDDCFKRCDVVDLTFACIGAVDSMQNCLDWVNNGRSRKAVVIASDLSKYELFSTGEYTQGAGAVAMLLTKDPSIMAISPDWGIGFKSVGDFFKPRRTYRKDQLVRELASQLTQGENSSSLKEAVSQFESAFWKESSAEIAIYKEEPVFDGQYSNQCYSDRITEALADLSQNRKIDFLEDWDHLIFHLPYAYHGRRIILDNWLSWIETQGRLPALIDEIGPMLDDLKLWKRKAAKSKLFQTFVLEKIERGERASSRIGNMYTASIFMSLISLCASALEESIDLTGDQVGLIAYGSGSKSKVFEGTFMTGWAKACANLDVFKVLDRRLIVAVEDYEALHKKELDSPLKDNPKVYLSEIEAENALSLGLRTYKVNK